MFKQEAGDKAMVGEAAAGAEQQDLEAAEQLIQLSGGDGADADDGGSESRSADSVNKCCARADRAGGEEKIKDREAAVESRLRRSGGWLPSATGKKKGGELGGVPAGEPDRKRADSVSRCPGADRAGRKEKEKGKEVAVESRRRSAERFPAAGVVGGGEERRRPRFRWLADLYRETRQVYMATPERLAAGGDDPPEGERRRKRKRAAGDADEETTMAMVPEASKERTMVA